MQLRDFRCDIEAPGMWGFFGGSIEFGEEPVIAARRELLEELNIEIESLHQITTESEINDLPGIYSSAFTFFINKPINKIVLSEGVDLKYVNYEELCSGNIFSIKLGKMYPIVKTNYIQYIGKNTLNYWKNFYSIL